MAESVIFNKKLNQLRKLDCQWLNENAVDIAKRVAFIVDFEYYFNKGQSNYTPREVSLYSVRENVVYCFQIYFSSKEECIKKDATVNYQINAIHGLPFVYFKRDKNYVTLEEFNIIFGKLVSCIQPNEVIGYKGGDFERIYLSSYNIPCINLEVLGCLKYEQLLIQYNITHNCCPAHKKDKLYHCSKYEVILFGIFVQKIIQPCDAYSCNMICKDLSNECI